MSSPTAVSTDMADVSMRSSGLNGGSYGSLTPVNCWISAVAALR